MTGDLILSPPKMTGVATYPPGATFGPRRTRDHEFVWVIEGEVEYRRDDEVFPARPGSVLLCRPGGTDAFRWDEHGPTRHGFFHFEVHAFPSYWPPPEDWPVVRRPAEGDVLRPLFRHLLTWADRGDPVLLQTTMAHMLASFVTGEISTRDVPASPLPAPVERAHAHIQDLLETDPSVRVTLAELARHSHVSPEHLCRLFKAATGHSPVETVRLARLDRAAVLLARTNFSVSEVASACGFASPYHFSRRFKEAFGLPPSRLREEIQAGATPPVPRLSRTRPVLG